LARLPVEPVRFAPGVDTQALQIGGVAEILEQHEAPFEIGGEDARHAHAGGREHFRGVDEGGAVLGGRRRVHCDDAALAIAVDAEVAAEAGVVRGRPDRFDAQGMLPAEPRQPGAEFVEAGVGSHRIRGSGPGGRRRARMRPGHRRALRIIIDRCGTLATGQRPNRVTSFPSRRRPEPPPRCFVLVFLAAMLPGVAQAQSHGAGPGPLRLRMDPALGANDPVPTESGRPIFAQGQHASGRANREFTLEGNAEVRHAGTVVRGNRITWYEDDEELVAVVNVRVVRGGSVFVGEGLQLRLDSNTGSFRAPTYELPLYDGRGEADRLDFLGGRRVGLVNATYTTCEPEDPDWYLRADELTIDEERGEGRGRGARLYFKDVQLL